MLADAALAALGATPPEDRYEATLELLKNRNDSIATATAKKQTKKATKKQATK